MNFMHWIVWGFAGTVVLTTIMAGCQGLGLTRMDIPFMLGTMVTPNRDRARLYGVLMHLVNGWIFAIVYLALFHVTRVFTWWMGGIVGLVHALFVLAVAVPIFPALHPRMASETHGPTVVRMLEPPGFLARHYGVRTPILVVVAHIVFGVLLGALYRP